MAVLSPTAEDGYKIMNVEAIYSTKSIVLEAMSTFQSSTPIITNPFIPQGPPKKWM